MKIISPLITASLFIFSHPSFAKTDCEQLKACDAKVCQVKNKIKLAKQAGYSAKEDALNTALTNIIHHCNDDELKKENQEDIDESLQEIKEYQQELKKAKAEGYVEDIKKYQQKISEEKIKLEEYQKIKAAFI